MRLIAVFLLALMSLPCFAESYRWQEQMKGGFKKGFLLTCEPTIESQLDRAGILDRISLEQRISYCTCVGIGIFDDFTVNEIKEFIKINQLPMRKQRMRQEFSNRCADKLAY